MYLPFSLPPSLPISPKARSVVVMCQSVVQSYEIGLLVCAKYVTGGALALPSYDGIPSRAQFARREATSVKKKTPLHIVSVLRIIRHNPPAEDPLC